MHLPKVIAKLKQPFFFLLVMVFVTVTFFFSPLQAFAQYQSPYTPNTNPDVPENLHTLAQSVTLEVLSSTTCLLSGIDIATRSTTCLGFDPQTKKIGYIQGGGGLLGLSGQMLSYVMIPPQIHTSQYVQYLSGNFGLVKKIYAQTPQQRAINQAGTGFASLIPILPIWTVFRNIVYVLFVVLFILVGFAIMLRYKIDPRTVMTIENQLPKLIVNLILVTFSFAIAGLLIDVMWVATFVVITVLTTIPCPQNAKSCPTIGVSQQVVNHNIFQNPFGFFNNVASGGFLGVAAGGGGSMKDVVQSLFSPENSNRLGLGNATNNGACGDIFIISGVSCILQGRVSDLVAGSVASFMASVMGWLLGWLVSVLGFLVILFALLIAMFRLWFTLLLSYAYILIDVLIGPFLIAFGVFPGSKIDMSVWIRDLLANLVSFPVAIAMFLLANLLMNSFANPTAGGQLATFVPPLIGNPSGTLGLGGSGSATTGNPIGFLIGIALILMTPQVVAMMKDLFKAPNVKYTQAIFQGLTLGAAPLGAGIKGVSAYTQKNLLGTQRQGFRGVLSSLFGI